MRNRLLLIGASALILCATASAQTPAPLIVQPANQTAAAPPVSMRAKPDDSDTLDAIKALEEMKAANDELLKKQQAMLDGLDQLQIQADQLRIFAKRG
jgi:hypothetical protein